MCGFFGIKSKKLNSVKAYRALQTMTRRGPDEEGVYLQNDVYFGHKRLVVVDRENGKQPFIFENYAMIYNGELYNTEELRNDLKAKGYLFTGHSDTEVLIKLYAEYKEQCLEKLNGIFAFMIYDSQTDRVFACRDRAGVKPLFYYFKDGELACASEIKALVNYYGINLITQNGLREVLGLGPSHSPGTEIFKGVHELRPAHYLYLDHDQLFIRRYWQVESLPYDKNFSETVSKVRFLVEDAVIRQLISDVPLCTYLSGGLDSTIITLIARLYKPDLETYSIDYKDNRKYFTANQFQVAEDNDFIQLVSSRYKITHHSCVIDNEQLTSTLKDALFVRDVPGMADIDSSLLWFSRQIKPKFTVALSGECADEIFGGYPWFYRNYNHDSFPWLTNLTEREKLLNETYRHKLQLKDYVGTRYEETLKETPLSGFETEAEKKQKEMAYLNMLWFMTTLLDRKDRMTMGASLEVRVPFADHRIMELLYNIPWEMKFYENREKGLLREAVKDIVPEEIVYRKKNPYPKTHHPEYENLVRVMLKERLLNKDSVLYELFDNSALLGLMNPDNKSFSLPWYGQLMTKPQLLAYLYQVDLWFEAYNLNIEEQ